MNECTHEQKHSPKRNNEMCSKCIFLIRCFHNKPPRLFYVRQKRNEWEWIPSTQSKRCKWHIVLFYLFLSHIYFWITTKHAKCIFLFCEVILFHSYFLCICFYELCPFSLVFGFTSKHYWIVYWIPLSFNICETLIN